MHLSFIFPSVLWLLLLLPPLWALTLAVPRRLSQVRFWSSLILRTLLLLALIMALAGAQLVRPVDYVTTVFLIDSSDSISPSARGQAEAFVQEALRAMRPGDRAAVVVFGENALVERAPSSEQVLGRLHSTPIVAHTNIHDAIQLGLALLPAETQKRLVLLSDGGENSGNAVEAARIAASRQIPIDYVNLGGIAGGAEALVANLEAPTQVRQGQSFELITTIESTNAQAARLRILGGEQVLFEQDVQLQPGPNRFSLPIEGTGQGFQHYRAQIEPQSDGRAQNNQAATLVRIGGPARVLLVEGRINEGQNLKAALAESDIVAETITPAAFPADLTALGTYEAVVLLNVPARDLPVKAIAALPGYVRDLGKGLIMIGGEASFGVGGYGRTPIEEALPVYMDVRDREDRPDLALVFVIDKSGSMDACHCSGPNRQTAQFQQGGIPKIDIAKDAVIQAAALLGQRDTVGVVAFDNGAHWVVPPHKESTSAGLESALAPIPPDGGTNVHAGLVAAEEQLKQIDARIKHIILLTDGWSGGGDNLDVARRMVDSGITLSVVAAGSGSADYLERLAQAGSGRYYPAENMEDVPQIFVQETITTVGNYLIEEPFTPKYASTSAILAGLEAGVPPLYGYNGTTLKETASLVLTSANDSPVLAQWQYGLGRAVAWTSDLKGKWAKDWVGWEAFPRFAAQLVGWVIPSSTNSTVTTEISHIGTQTVIDARVQDDQSRPREDLEMQATLIGSDETTQQILLKQVAPGQYHASFPSPVQGTYLIQVSGSGEGNTVIQETVGMVVPYSAEYRQGQSNPDLLETLAQISGGRPLEQATNAFEHNLSEVTSAQEIALPLLLLVLLLLPLDIGIRRLILRRSDFTLSGALRKPQHTPAPIPHLEQLQRAKARAYTARHSPSPASPTEVPSSQTQSELDVPSSPENTSVVEQEPLDRLRAAKERARRQARGEE